MHQRNPPRSSFLPSSKLRSRSVIYDHCITHIPTRSSCRESVEGRGRKMAYACVDHAGSRSIAMVAFDCLSAAKNGVYTTEMWNDDALREELEESWLKIIVF